MYTSGLSPSGMQNIMTRNNGSPQSGNQRVTRAVIHSHPTQSLSNPNVPPLLLSPLYASCSTSNFSSPSSTSRALRVSQTTVPCGRSGRGACRRPGGGGGWDRGNRSPGRLVLNAVGADNCARRGLPASPTPGIMLGAPEELDVVVAPMASHVHRWLHDWDLSRLLLGNEWG